MDFDAQPSSSTSLSLLSNVQIEMDKLKTWDKIKDEQVEKRLTEESKPDAENQVEVVGPCFIEELPPEMLMKVLKYLDAPSLKFSRLMNVRWNEFAREIIQSREEVETVFHCCPESPNCNEDLKIGGRSEIASLENFITCFENSKETPLTTAFRFNNIKASVFKNVNWIKFFSDFGHRIKCLKLVIQSHFDDDGQLLNTETHNYDQNQDLTELLPKLANLLLNQLPNLQEFGFSIPNYYQYSNPSIIKLFTDSLSSTRFKLPHLKILHLDDNMFTKFTGIAADLLEAATNLEKIECFSNKGLWIYGINANLLFPHCLGKLHCLQIVQIQVTLELVSAIKEQSSAPLEFKLKKLDLYLGFIIRRRRSWSRISEFVSNLFESSKDTLTDLTIDPMGFLPDLHLPKFSKLTTLLIDGRWEHSSPDVSDRHIAYLSQFKKILPSGFNLLEIFPVLQCLELRVPWTDFFGPDQSISSLPNLQTLVITGREMTGQVVAQIAEVCPNLKKFGIYHEFNGKLLENFPQVGTAIWTHMEKLQSLDLAIDSNSDANAFPAVDSCITGFSAAYCEHLFNLVGIEKSLKMEDVTEAELDTERRNPSILDLKDLKHLIIRLVNVPRDVFESYSSEDDADEDTEEEESEEEISESEELEQEMMKETLTFISEEYALKLMKNLSFEIEMHEEL